MSLVRLLVLCCFSSMLSTAGFAATELERIIERSGSAAAGDGEEVVWSESEVAFPAPPQSTNLIEAYVSSATSNQFLVDPESISVNSDGVVRYTLVVLSAQGARNVSFEGMRCSTRERRLYASGRLDGSWSKSRTKKWVRIEEADANRHYAALFLDYFCPDGIAVRTADDARAALRRGAPRR